MTSHSGRKYRFFLLLAFVLTLPAIALAWDWADTVSLSTTIITIGFGCVGLLALYVAYLTVRFLITAFKESAQAKKEAAAHATPSEKKTGATFLGLAFGLSALYAVLAVGILFIVFLFVLSGLDLSATKAMSSLLITLGFGGFVLLFLYIVYLLASILWKAVAKPSQAAPAPVEEAAAPGFPLAAPVTRRSFLSLLGWAWVVFTAASMGALSTVLRFFFPNVTFEPPLKFKAGYPDTYKMGVDERFKDAHRCWIVRNDQGFYALSTICTHLGCTPNWMQADQKFKCPCHGSGYYITGVNFEGPAPRPLPRFNIILADDGQIQIDEAIQYQQELGQWGLPGSFLDYKA
ncbi:MAG TPA: ubiquinol-cytochrome c reductase iron-sulfur subunit [bacterium]|nr:ubiquinol-cytochrome c reductase iron-sulfur subunit [bacterium]